MRLFIAIRFNEEITDALIEAQNQMYNCGVRGNYTPEENLHLTLTFIGEYRDPEQVLTILENVSFTPFELSLDGFGNFGNLWWAGIRNSPALQAVVRRIRKALSEAQVPFDRKAFHPHVTLIRKAQAQNSLPGAEVPDARMQVDTVSLMRSDRGKNGMIYTELGIIQAEK